MKKPERKPTGLRIVGWGPFRLPGERKRMERAEKRADEMMQALKELRERDRG